MNCSGEIPWESPWIVPGGLTWERVIATLDQVRRSGMPAVVGGRVACWTYGPSTSIHKVVILSAAPAALVGARMGWRAAGDLPFGGKSLDIGGVPVLWINRNDWAAPLYRAAYEGGHGRRLPVPVCQLIHLAAMKAAAGVPRARSKDLVDIEGWLTARRVTQSAIETELARCCDGPERGQALRGVIAPWKLVA